MMWVGRILCALGWTQACPTPPDPERAEKRAILDRTVEHHRLDDEDERIYQATRARVDMLLEGERRARQRRGREGTR